MEDLAKDEQWMRRALALAAEAAPFASPNPAVGCVLVAGDDSGEVMGEGAHFYDRRDHAEIAALKDAAARGRSAAGATAYVTLEPCSHQGRTGPCADALIAAGVVRVVVATVDPNPLVRGQGIVRLRAAGVEVVTGVCRQAARDLIEAFAFAIQHGRPFVTLKAALSVDGKLAPPPALRKRQEPFWLTGAEARAEVQQMRHRSDAILTGIGTVLADDPELTDRTGRRRRRPLLRVVMDTHLRTPPRAKLLRSVPTDTTTDHHVLILCGRSASPSRIAALQAEGLEVEMLPDHGGHLSLAAALSTLASRDIRSVLLEGGSRLNGGFLAANLVDKAVLFYAETELGEAAMPFAAEAPSPFLLEQGLSRVTRTSYGPDACVTGYVHDPWRGVPADVTPADPLS